MLWDVETKGQVVKPLMLVVNPWAFSCFFHPFIMQAKTWFHYVYVTNNLLLNTDYLFQRKEYAFTHISPYLLQFCCIPHLRKAKFSGVCGGRVAVSPNAV